MAPNIRILPEPEVLPGNRAIKKRSYPLARKNFFRMIKGEEFKINIEFLEDISPESAAVCFESLATEPVRHWDITLNKTNKGFEGSVNFQQCGTHRFKLKYFHNDTWYWDNKPYSYVIVDRKDIEDLKFYIFIPTASGHINDWKKDLDRIKGMGFNAVHLLPVTAQGYSESPYAASDLFQIDPAYTDPNDERDGIAQFESFVESLKQNDIRLCIDLVFNNIGVDSKIRVSHPDWLAEDPQEKDGIRRGGWSDGNKWHKWGDLAFLNYNNLNKNARDELWDHMTAYALFWSRFAAETGGMVRLDNLHSSNELFMRHVLSEIRKQFPDLIILAELFDHEFRIEKLSIDYGITLLLATPWEHKFVPELRGHLKYLHSRHKQYRYFVPICSHDARSPAVEFGDVRSTIPRLVVSSLMGSGPSGIVQGIEYGLEQRINFIGKRPRTEYQINQEFFDFIQKVNQIIDEHGAFHCPGNLRFIDNDHHAILGALRTDPKTKQPGFLIFANLDISKTQKIHVNLRSNSINLKDIILKDLVTGKAYCHRNADNLTLKLEPCGIKIFKIA